MSPTQTQQSLKLKHCPLTYDFLGSDICTGLGNKFYSNDYDMLYCHHYNNPITGSSIIFTQFAEDTESFQGK